MTFFVVVFFLTFASMRIILVFILLTFGFNKTTVNSQQTTDFVHKRATDNSQQTLCTSDACSRTVDRCPLSVDYYESQIRKADSLYKNYLPQYNFDEVKAAMEFFDSLQLSKTTDNRPRTTDFVHRIFPNKRQRTICTVLEPVEGTISCASTSSATSFSQTVDCCPLSVDFNCAKAHYYHAVGLTEKDDIVGACEHYLTALEIMEEDDLIKRHKDAKTQRRKVLKKQRNDEKTLCDSVTLRLCDSNKEDYEKIRFVALICNRLGRLFYNENYCDLAIIKYRKAIDYVNLIKDFSFEAILLKELANSYQLSDNADSAMVYYNKSLETNSNLTNKLDVVKCIAQILFDKGEKDSAYILIKNNIDKIVNYGPKESYYAVLGEMYYEDNIYDSAIYYLEKSFTSENISVKISSAINLSAIYDSIMDYDKKVYYDNFISKHTIKDVNKSVERSKCQYVYNNYKERKQERDRMKNLKKTYFIILLLLSLFVLTFIVAMFIKRKYKIKHIELSSSLNNKEAEINIKNEIINQIRGEIEVKEKQLQELKFKQSQIEGKIKNRNAELQKKDDIIKKCEIEISELKSKLERGQTGIKNIEKYLSSEICLKILKEIKELSDKNIDTSELSSLEQGDFVLLLNSANQNFNNLINNIASTHTKLKKEDLYYLCLTIIGLNDKQISSLFGVTYTAINKRRNKISNILGVDIKEYMYKYIQYII